uniref:Uncharacterized protein n=1 Tax=Tanacetum cinerariifolium TaxID=118510 RepID=A0A6L2K9A5_TANCI|nr:hypothetical protein [Tanacetum cinerariifolium]
MIPSNETQEPNRGIRDNKNVLSTSIPLSPSNNVYRLNIISSTPDVGHPFTTTNASSQATQIRIPRGQPCLNEHALTDITNIHGSSQLPQAYPPNVLPTSQNVSPKTNVAPVTNHTNCSSQATQVPRLKGRPCLRTRALTDIINIRSSAQPPHFCSPNVLSTTNVSPLTTETNGSSQATKVRRRRGLPSQHDHMSSLINPTPPVMLSSITIVDNQRNLRHLPQSSCVTNSANSMTNVIALNNSTPRHISESSNTDQNGTDVPAIRTGCQYNLPTALEFAALIPGDGNSIESRDVIVEEHGNKENRNGVKRISLLHPSFMALQYPLLSLMEKMGFICIYL